MGVWKGEPYKLIIRNNTYFQDLEIDYHKTICTHLSL